MMCSFNFCGTETGRTTTNKLKPPLVVSPEGLAFQTLTKFSEVGGDLRTMFVPDNGFVFIEADMSQAEARIVALLARDDFTLDMFAKYDRTKDPKYDLHRITASWFCGILPEKIAKDSDERQLGKKVRHAGNYDMGKHRLALLAQISEWKANKSLITFHAMCPNIRAVFYVEIQEALAKCNRVLINPYGRPRQFLNKWGDDLFKEGYAHIPQSTVPDHLKRAMLKMRYMIPGYFKDWFFCMESHDSFTALVKKYYAERFRDLAKPIMEEPIDFRRCTLSREVLTIPSEFVIGHENLKDMKSFN